MSGTAGAPRDGLWGIGEPACPAGPSGATSGTASARDTTRRSSVASASLGDTGSTRRPAIILRASASAREVRFARQPQIVVRLCGGTLDSVHVIERRNLPSPVVAGTTYRDVYVAVEILGHLDAACIRSTLGAGGSTPTPGACGSLSVGGGATTGGASTPPPSAP